MKCTRALSRTTAIAALLVTARVSIAQTPVQITEFPAGGQAVPITVGPDGNFWMTFNGTNAIGRMTPNGTVTIFNITGTGFPEVVFGHCVDGRDGGVWCSNGGGPIVRTDVATGASSIFNGFPPDSGANDITLGPDGAIWFTDFGFNRVGRMTLSGVVTEYSIPAAFIGPRSITVGPDHALWFTSDNGQVGRLDTSGGGFLFYNLPEFPILIAQLGAITTGPDGNLWLSAFGSTGSTNIVRVTPGGVITEYPIGTSASNILDITTGPDGALWFTEQFGNKIGRMTVAGSFTEYSLASGAGPTGITVGWDQAIWFTELYPGKVGRLSGGPLAAQAIPALGAETLVLLGAALAITGWFVLRGSTSNV
jgi:virginiamycin B lyase